MFSRTICITIEKFMSTLTRGKESRLVRHVVRFSSPPVLSSPSSDTISSSWNENIQQENNLVKVLH